MASKSLKNDEFKTQRNIWIMVSVLVFAVIFPETRFSILMLPIWLKFVANKKTYNILDKDKDSTSKLLLYPFLLILITAIFFSDYRVYGVSVTRFMVMLTQSYETEAIIWSVIIAFALTLIYATRNNDVPRVVAIAIASSMATIPVLISQDSNFVDWILIYILMAGVVTSIGLKVIDNKYAFLIFQYCAFAWLTMSWGAWGGGISMIYFGAKLSLIHI